MKLRSIFDRNISFGSVEINLMYLFTEKIRERIPEKFFTCLDRTLSETPKDEDEDILADQFILKSGCVSFVSDYLIDISCRFLTEFQTEMR